MHEVTETISISKKREVLEPTKYYTEIGERIIKYKSKSYYCFKHYDKKNEIIKKIEFIEKKISTIIKDE